VTPIESAIGIWKRRPFREGTFLVHGENWLEFLLPEQSVNKEDRFCSEIRALPIESESVGRLLRFDGWCRAWNIHFKAL